MVHNTSSYLLIKIILVSLLVNLPLQASYIQMQHYANQKQHKKVLKEAKYSFEDYQNPKLHLLWAKSAQKLGKTTIAMSAYERVLILQQDNQEAQKALAAIYAKTHRKGLLHTASGSNNKNKLKAKTDLSFGYDTNINVNASGDDLDGYYGITLGLKKVSSSFAKIRANASYLYNFEEYDNWFIQSTLNVYYQNNFSAHLYDLTVPTLEFALGYIKDDYLFYFPMSYNNINYLNKDLLNIFSFTPHVRISFLKNTLWDTSVIYSRRNYIESIDKTKDATTYGIQTGIYWNTDPSQLYANIKYEHRSADKNQNDRFIDANFFTFDANYKYYFTTSLIMESHYLFRYSDYSDNIGTDATPSKITRDDYINEIEVKLSYLLNKDMEIYMSDTYTKSLSTYIPAEYNKNVFQLGFQVRY